jgi:hypothetical protein
MEVGARISEGSEQNRRVAAIRAVAARVATGTDPGADGDRQQREPALALIIFGVSVLSAGANSPS